MLAKVKQLIDEHGLPEYKKNIQDVSNPHKYVRSYHKHSFILTNKQSRIPDNLPGPKFMVNNKEMVIILTGRETYKSPICVDNVDKIILDLRNHIGGSLENAVKILQNIYGNTTLFKTDYNWYSMKDGVCILEKSGQDLAFQGIILVLVSNKTASTGEILALSFMCRQNAWVIGNPTAGYLTMNSYYEIDKNHILNLTISKIYDIQGNTYPDERIIPSTRI